MVEAPAGATGPLSHLRVVDLTDRRGWLAGRVLADLGAAVVKVEAPGGDRARVDRRVAPDLVSGGPDPAWLAFNRGKKFVTLDIASPTGRALMLRLVADSDIVLESSDPGRLDELGLDYGALSTANPSVVLTSISAFGQTGPYSRWASSDLVVAAMGGAVWVNGDPDRPPVRVGSDQYHLHASAEAAAHTVAAAHHAARTGVGQQVDVSAQLATIRTLMNVAQGPNTDGSVVDRRPFGQPAEQQPYQSVFECADGHIMVSVGFGPGAHGVVQWLRDDDALSPPLNSLTQEQLTSPTLLQDLPRFPTQLNSALRRWFRAQYKATLAAEALRRRIMLVPISSVADLVTDEHLQARGYFADVEYEGVGTVTTPWGWVKMSGSPLVEPSGVRAPGADNTRVWCERIGVAPADLSRHEQAGVV